MKNELKITELVRIDFDEVKKEALKTKEKIENAVEVKRNEENGCRLMKDANGRVFMTAIELPTFDEMQYGYAVQCNGCFNEENIGKAYEVVLDKMCEIVRDVAKRFPDKFFIVKDANETGADFFTVGCKLTLPFGLGDNE